MDKSVFYHIWGGVKYDLPGNEFHEVKIKHQGNRFKSEPRSGQGSNIRWLYIGDDKHMLYAYGGADLDVTGHVMTIHYQKVRLWWLVEGEWYWSGRVHVTLGDQYTYASGDVKEAISAYWSDSYDAALWLEENCGHKPFYHMTSFDLEWNKEGPPKGYPGL